MSFVIVSEYFGHVVVSTRPNQSPHSSAHLVWDTCDDRGETSLRITGEKESEKVNDVGGGRAAARPRYAQVENCMTGCPLNPVDSATP